MNHMLVEFAAGDVRFTVPAEDIVIIEQENKGGLHFAVAHCENHTRSLVSDNKGEIDAAYENAVHQWELYKRMAADLIVEEEDEIDASYDD